MDKTQECPIASILLKRHYKIMERHYWAAQEEVIRKLTEVNWWKRQYRRLARVARRNAKQAQELTAKQQKLDNGPRL